MPTDLPVRQRVAARKRYIRYGEFALNAAMLVSVLFLGAMVTIRAQQYVPHPAGLPDDATLLLTMP